MRENLAQHGNMTYTKMVMDIAVVYILAAMKANGKVPKEVKNYGYQQAVREEGKDSAGTGDAEQAKKAAKTVNAISNEEILLKYVVIETEHAMSLADQYLINHKGLCAALTGELGLSILSSINFAELAQDTVLLLEELIKQPVTLLRL